MAVVFRNDEMEGDRVDVNTQKGVEAEAAATVKQNATKKRLSLHPVIKASLSVVEPPPQLSPGVARCSFARKIRIQLGKFYLFIEMLKESSSYYLRRVFTLPLVRGYPISYACPEDFDAAGERVRKKDQDVDDYEKAMDLLEVACNYTEKTNMMFQKIIADRKEFATSKTRYAKDLDWSKLAPWNESFLGHLESTFQVFDSSNDASTALADYGDKTSPEDRYKVFSSSLPAGKGALTFNGFVTMFHDITVKSPDSYPSTIVESFRSIDRNMARIRGLDVVQRLQAGLF